MPEARVLRLSSGFMPCFEKIQVLSTGISLDMKINTAAL
jgi:hypothetical protein